MPYIGTVKAGPYGAINRDFFTGEPAYNGYDRGQAVLGYEFKHQFDDVWSIRHNAKYISVDDSYRTFFSGGYVETGGVTDYTKMRRNAIDYSSNNQVFATDTNLRPSSRPVRLGTQSSSAPTTNGSAMIIRAVMALATRRWMCSILATDLTGSQRSAPVGTTGSASWAFMPRIRSNGTIDFDAWRPL